MTPLWHPTIPKGPAEQACTSSRDEMRSLRGSRQRAQPRLNHNTWHHPARGWFPAPSHCQHYARAATSATMGYGMAANGPSGQPRTQKKNKLYKVVYEDTSGDVLVPAPPGGKTLKINVDLMLWRSRQARIAALLTLDEQQRRELFKEAEEQLRRCLVLDPADPRTYVVLGKLYMVQRRYEEARALYAEGTTNTGNTNAYIWAAWGWLEFKTGNVTRARQLFDASTVVDSTHACAWHKWGLLEKSEGNYPRARDLWMEGIQRCKQKPQAQNAYLYNALAVMAAELKRVGEARQWFREGTSTLEGAASVALWQAWAVMEAEQGDPTEVRKLFSAAAFANKRSRYVYLAWAWWERKNGNLLRCIKLLEDGIAFNPTDAALYQARALVEWRNKQNPAGARHFFQLGVRADPRHLPVWQAWGCMEARLGNVQQARELFQQAVWADPRSKDSVYVLHAWGCLERDQGNVQVARELFKAAIKVNPKAEKVWYTWIGMETEEENFTRVEELKIRQAEQQWEFEVPAGFTTRPGGAASPLSALKDVLANFFNARGTGVQDASANKSRADAVMAQRLMSTSFDETDTSLEEAWVADSKRGGDGALSGPDAAALAFGAFTGAAAVAETGDEFAALLPRPSRRLAQVLITGGELDLPQQSGPSEATAMQGSGDVPSGVEPSQTQQSQDLLQPAVTSEAATVRLASSMPSGAPGLTSRPRYPAPTPLNQSLDQPQ